jgi:NAD(P)-dependent dehydrogenase (short-subunit alcohol dehydrogenase family)
MIEAARRRWGQIDVLHYNVGVSIAAGDAPLDQITEAAFDRIATINLRGAIMACKHVLPLMRVCFWLRTRRISLLASRYRSMAARLLASTKRQALTEESACRIQKRLTTSSSELAVPGAFWPIGSPRPAGIASCS